MHSSSCNIAKQLLRDTYSNNLLTGRPYAVQPDLQSKWIDFCSVKRLHVLLSPYQCLFAPLEEVGVVVVATVVAGIQALQ
jgi:hypothetical protein